MQEESYCSNLERSLRFYNLCVSATEGDLQDLGGQAHIIAIKLQIEAPSRFTVLCKSLEMRYPYK